MKTWNSNRIYNKVVEQIFAHTIVYVYAYITFQTQQILKYVFFTHTMVCGTLIAAIETLKCISFYM